MTYKVLKYPEDGKEYNDVLDILIKNTETKIHVFTNISAVVTTFILGFLSSLILFIMNSYLIGSTNPSLLVLPLLVCFTFLASLYLVGILKMLPRHWESIEKYDKLTLAKINPEKWCIQIKTVFDAKKGLDFSIIPIEEQPKQHRTSKKTS